MCLESIYCDLDYMKKIFIIFVLLIYSQFIFSAEPDDFKSYKVELSDSTAKVNKIVNSRLLSFKDTLKEKEVCNKGAFSDRSVVVSTLSDYLNSNFSYVGNAIADWEGNPTDIETAKSITAYQPMRLSHSSYSGVESFTCCFGIGSANINGVVLGIDKIDHFFGNGGLLWLEIEANKHKLPAVVVT